MLLAATLGVMMSTTSFEPKMPKKTILVFSRTKGFRHDSIPDGKRAIWKICENRDWAVTFTEDPTWFEGEKLKGFDAIVFLCTTGDILDPKQQPVFEEYIRAGGGYVGVHAAADTEYDWPWYGKLVGGYFKSHPKIQEAVIHVEDLKHPATKHLPNPWKRTDEWYDYKENPRGKVHVLARLDTKSYEGHIMGDDHPIMWCQEFEGGRAFYTGLGHTKESYLEANFLKMLGEAIEWSSAKRRKS
ncbi:MAG: ThuA domain-containing protein [Chlorobia bacterium]|nr:ThuA domain-containing protein [Fimbriimonadaceae bacterium]